MMKGIKLKKTLKVIGKGLSLLAKGIGFLLLAIIGFSLLLWFVWRPIKIAQYKPVFPEHIEQKGDYLASISSKTADHPNIIVLATQV